MGIGVLLICVELEKKECDRGIPDLRMTAVPVSELLGICQSAVTRAAYRKPSLAAANNLRSGFITLYHACEQGAGRFGMRSNLYRL